MERKHRSCISLTRSCTVLCLLATAFLIPTCVDPQPDDPDQPLRITALPSVDENLFALRLLGDIYVHWPDLKGNRSELRTWFSDARSTTSAMVGEIRARHLDSDLELLFNDCLDYMSATESYLANLDLLENQRNTGTIWDVISSTWNGYKTGSDVSSEAGKLGMSEENAANAGKLVGAADAAANYYSKSQARDANYRNAIAEQARKLEDKWNITWSSLQTVSRQLTLKYRWAPGEAGFDGFQSSQLTDLIARSPRDPFLRVRYGDAIMQEANSADQCMTAMNAYLAAARLVPIDSVYDSLRLQYVGQALKAAVAAPSIEAGDRGYSAHPSNAGVAVKIARTYIAMDTQDTTGVGHVQLARALAFAGRYEEAAASAAAAYQLRKEWGNDPWFCFRYAKLLSLTGDLNLVGDWIVQAYRSGFHNVAEIRTDPEFELFRIKRPQQFQNLTSVTWRWHVKYGLMLDDVVIENTSPFDLTNVQVQLHIRKGTRAWNPIVKCAQIAAGSSCQADNVMSISGDSYDEGSGVLSSDQT